MDNLTTSEIKDLVLLCEKDIGIEYRSAQDHSNFQEVINWLQQEIQNLLNHDIQKLLQVLYRIDISEQTTKEVFSMSDPSDMSSVLTRLIVQRELQKVETRKKYRPH